MNSSMITAIATSVLALGVIVAIVQLWLNKRGTKKISQAQIAIGLRRELRTRENIRGLRSIYRIKPEEARRLSNLTNDQYDALDGLDMLGVLVNNGVAEEKLAIEGYAGASVLRCWYQLHDFIRGMREHRGTNHYENLEDLARRTLDYANRYHANEKWILLQVDDGSSYRIIDLVEEMNSTESLRPNRIRKV